MAKLNEGKREIIAKKSYLALIISLAIMFCSLLALMLAVILYYGGDMAHFDWHSYDDQIAMDSIFNLIAFGGVIFVGSLIFFVRQLFRKHVLLTYQDGKLIFADGELVYTKFITNIVINSGDIEVQTDYGVVKKVRGAKDYKKVYARLNEIVASAKPKNQFNYG